jgi:enoyl-CoA hydratase
MGVAVERVLQRRRTSVPGVSDSVNVSIEDGVCVVRLDDGKANAVSHDLIDAVHAALDRSEAEATAVAIIGREGKFSAGFDLSVMSQGPDAIAGLVGAGGRLLMRVFTHRQPVVAGVTGHALAAGALLCLAADTRIGADRPAKIGLNETAIGMGLPWYGIKLGQARLAHDHVTRAVLQAEIFDPAGAVIAGYLDRIVDPADVEAHAITEARRLGQLPASAYGFTKNRLRQALADELLAGLDADMSNMVQPAKR